MWKIWLLAGAVGVATLVATVAIGRPLAEPDDAAEPAASTQPHRTWAEQATERCRKAIRDVRAELSGASGLATTAERAVLLFGATTEIEGRLLRLLRALPPPSAAEQRRIEEALGLLEKQYKRDVATTARLERQYDYALLNLEVVAYESVAARMRALFGELGARGCVAYFDPESYR